MVSTVTGGTGRFSEAANADIGHRGEPHLLRRRVLVNSAVGTITTGQISY
jgi:hypothetical protein